MKAPKRTYSAWYYGLGLLALILGLSFAGAVLYGGARSLPGAIGAAYDLDRLTQVVVPGSVTMRLNRTGAYAIYYESSSVVDGTTYVGPKLPPALACTLRQQGSGEELPLVPDYQAGNRYVSQNRLRVGTLFMSTTVDEPGTYTFVCTYPGGVEQAQVVLAFGQNLVWELFHAVGRSAVALFAALAILALALLAALIITTTVAVKRRQTRAQF